MVLTIDLFYIYMLYIYMYIYTYIHIHTKQLISASIEIIMIFTFTLLMWCIMFNDLHMLNPPCIPEINLILSWCMILLMCYWIWFASILFRILHLLSSGILAFDFPLLKCPYLAFKNQHLIFLFNFFNFSFSNFSFRKFGLKSSSNW